MQPFGFDSDRHVCTIHGMRTAENQCCSARLATRKVYRRHLRHNEIGFRTSWWLVLALLSAAYAMLAQAAENSELRAYPEPLPEDFSFDTVVQSQSFPFMK